MKKDSKQQQGKQGRKQQTKATQKIRTGVKAGNLNLK